MEGYLCKDGFLSDVDDVDDIDGVKVRNVKIWMSNVCKEGRNPRWKEILQTLPDSLALPLALNHVIIRH